MARPQARGYDAGTRESQRARANGTALPVTRASLWHVAGEQDGQLHEGYSLQLAVGAAAAAAAADTATLPRRKFARVHEPVPEGSGRGLQDVRQVVFGRVPH